MTNPSKFYSGALEAAEKVAREIKKEQPLKKLREALVKHGAKSTEIKHLGIDDLIAEYPDESITPTQLLEHIDRNKVLPEEILKTGVGKKLVSLGEETSKLVSDPASYEMVTGRKYPSFTPEQIVALGLYSNESVAGRYLSGYERGFKPAHQNRSPWVPRRGLIEDEDFGPVDPNLLYYITGGKRFSENPPKYKEYAGTREESPSRDYSEMLFKLPGNKYDAGHWHTPGVMSHMRFDPRPDVLRIEELQSDYHQKGRKRGYRPVDWEKQYEEAGEKYEDLYNKYYGPEGENLRRQARVEDEIYPIAELEDELMGLYEEMGVPRSTDFGARSRALQEAFNEANAKREELSALQYNPPLAPLSEVSDWTGMMARRALLEAAERGIPKIGVAGGNTQIDRYYGGGHEQLGQRNTGMRKFYDETVTGTINKLLRQYGGEPMARGKQMYPGQYSEDPMVEDFDPYWEAEMPQKLIEALRRRGKVPFFREGGAVR